MFQPSVEEWILYEVVAGSALAVSIIALWQALRHKHANSCMAKPEVTDLTQPLKCQVSIEICRKCRYRATCRVRIELDRLRYQLKRQHT